MRLRVMWQKSVRYRHRADGPQPRIPHRLGI